VNSAFLALPQDSEGFVRRECPHCRRQFKTRPFPQDGVALQRHLARRMPHSNWHESAGLCQPTCCLYCGRLAPPEEWFTLEQRQQLERIVTALLSEVRHEQLSFVMRTLSRNPRPTFVTMGTARFLPPMAPEPDDLDAVPMLCCGEEAKAESGWSPIASYCPRCGARQQILQQISPPPRLHSR
jgi:hypothetical protein